MKSLWTKRKPICWLMILVGLFANSWWGLGTLILGFILLPMPEVPTPRKVYNFFCPSGQGGFFCDN